MQNKLFPEPDEPSQKPSTGSSRSRTDEVRPVAPSDTLRALAQVLPASLRIGTSSWNFPGWAGLVWEGDYAEAQLSKQGLVAYAQHPLLRTVSLDRAFYRPLSSAQYASYAAQVPDDFRFVVKAPSLIADAMLRGEDGRSLQANPFFLDPERAVREFVQPALEGLGHKLGALVFQLSPLPSSMLRRMRELIAALDQLLAALPALADRAPEGVIAVEVRNREWLTPDLVSVLKAHRATYCLGLHAKMPPIAEQLPILRALWPGPLVCRWNLNMKHGAFGYEDAKRSYAPFNEMLDPDPATRSALARVIAGTVAAGLIAYVTINNKAEGSAPLSAAALAEAVRAQILSKRGAQ